MTNCTIYGNSASGNGGGIVGAGISVLDSTISGNTAPSGGGLQIGGATLTNCNISGNTASNGGGLCTARGTNLLTNCTVSGNSATNGGNGGGLFTAGGTTTLTNCTVSGNSGGGLDNQGTTTLINCTVSGNSGGGLDNQGTTTLINCTVSGNSAHIGGGLYNAGTTTLTNCTVSGNTGTDGSGGIYVSGTATLNNTIVAGNTDSSGASDIGGAGTVSGSNNLIGTGGSGGLSNGVDGNLVGATNPGLAPLGNYGGPTETMALLPGSAAIGAGTAGSGVTTDQRGAPRPTSGATDIGAFESSGFTITVTSGSGQSTGVLTAFPAPLVVTVTANNPSEPVAGGLVTFTPPPSGASATLSGSPATIGATGTASVTAMANATVGTYAVTASASGATSASYSLTNQMIQPSFAGLTGQTISYGSTVTFTGKLADGQQVPAGEKVAVTVDAVTHDATIASDGSFSTEFTSADVALNASSTAYKITYDYATDGVFLAADGSSQLKVNPAELTITAVSTSMFTGQPVPLLTAVYTGFVNGDTPATLTTQPVLRSTASPSSAPGGYPISVGGASSPNYTIKYVPGTLTVILAPATV